MTTHSNDEIKAWREEYGEYTLNPPPDWQPTGRLLGPRYWLAGQLYVLSQALYGWSRRVKPPVPHGDAIRAGAYPGAVDVENGGTR